MPSPITTPFNMFGCIMLTVNFFTVYCMQIAIQTAIFQSLHCQCKQECNDVKQKTSVIHGAAGRRVLVPCCALPVQVKQFFLRPLKRFCTSIGTIIFEHKPWRKALYSFKNPVIFPEGFKLLLLLHAMKPSDF